MEGSGMKESEGDRLKYAVCESTLSTAARSPFPNGEGYETGKAVSSYRSLPHWGRGTAPAVDRVLSFIVDLRRISSLSFIPLSPSNLRPFGAPPSIGRRECPREPLPLEGAGERSEAGLASFLSGEAASFFAFPRGKALCREKRCSRFAAFPIGEGGPRSGG